MLSTKTFLQLAGIIFGIIGMLHLLRIFTGWQIILVGLEIPVWLSGFGVVITWYLSYTAFTLAGKLKSKK
jgi:hypothetical protein